MGKEVSQSVDSDLRQYSLIKTGFEDVSSQLAEIASKNNSVTLEDYGALGDGVTDDRQAIINAFASGKNIILFPKTYAFSGILSLTLNNATVKCNSGYATFKALTSATLATTNGVGYGVIEFTGSNFTVENVKIDGSGTYIERPLHYSDYDNGYNTWYDTRKKTRPVLVLRTCDHVNLINVICSYGVSGFNLKNTTNFMLLKCESNYTLADSFFITDNSCYGLVKKCKATTNGDDSFSCVIDSANNAPHDVVFDSCIAENVQGALVCLHGSYNTKMVNSNGVNVKRCSIRLGGLKTGDGISTKGYNQIVDNCIITMVDYVGGNDPVPYGSYSGGGAIVEGANNDKTMAQNIKISNCTIERVNAPTNFNLYLSYCTNVRFENCTFKNVSFSSEYGNYITFDNCYFDLIDSMYLHANTYVKVINSHLNNQNLYHLNAYNATTYSNIILFNSGNVTITNNSYTYASSITTGYNTLEIRGDQDPSFNTILVDFMSIKTYAQTNYKLRYNGVFITDNSGILGTGFVYNFADGQLFLTLATGKIWSNKANATLPIVLS
jgi:hypothetical protein